MFTEIGKAQNTPYFLCYLPKAEPPLMWSVHRNVSPEHTLEGAYPFLAAAARQAVAEGMIIDRQEQGKFYPEVVHLPDAVIPHWQRMSEVAIAGLQTFTYNRHQRVLNLHVNSLRGNVQRTEVCSTTKTFPMSNTSPDEALTRKLEVRQVVRGGLALILSHAWLQTHIIASGVPGVLSYPQI